MKARNPFASYTRSHLPSYLAGTLPNCRSFPFPAPVALPKQSPCWFRWFNSFVNYANPLIFHSSACSFARSPKSIKKSSSHNIRVPSPHSDIRYVCKTNQTTESIAVRRAGSRSRLVYLFVNFLHSSDTQPARNFVRGTHSRGVCFIFARDRRGNRVTK